MSSPLRFCMVTTYYPPFHFGGDGMFVYRLSEALAEQGHRVDVVHSVDAYRLRRHEAPPMEFVHHPNVTRHTLETSWPRGAALAAHQMGGPAWYGKRLRKLLDDGAHDVIHFHNVSLMGGPGVLRHGRGVKLYTPHEYWLICPTHVLFKFNREACTRKSCLACTLHSGRPPQVWRRTGWLKKCVRSVDRFLMPSRFSLERHRAEGLDVPMTHLPNFVPMPAAADASNDTTGRPYFLFVGRLEKLKGVQDLISLFREYRDADLVIAGGGDEERELKQRANGLEHVKFLGAVHPTELSRLYRRAIAVMIPSLCYEVFPLTAAEALAHGTPIIARRIGALTEIVEESGGGYTFAAPEECRQAMERLQQDSALRHDLGERGRKTAMAQWTTEVHLHRYLDVIESVRRTRSGGAG